MKHIYYGENVMPWDKDKCMHECCEECDHCREHSAYIYDSSPEGMHLEGHYYCDKGEYLADPECEKLEEWEAEHEDD